MSAQIREGLTHLKLSDIQLSSTAAQVERRKHFDKGAIAELADSIKTVGLINPITVRPVNGHYELVAGERRFLAAGEAKLDTVIASVRDLSDELVLEVQLIENLQREGLHELAEAEGYEQLQKLGHSAEEIAHKLGKSKAYIYARMKLLALGPAAREAFYRGQLNASTALLLARIPVASVQREACGKITQGRYGNDGPISYRDARDYIEREYMLRLADAPFPTGDLELLPKAGPCGSCPKRTGNQPELFGDIKGADVCTDPVCFKLKREAFGKLQIEQAQATGKKVITGAEAKKVVESNHYSEHLKYSSGYAKLEDSCSEDPKYRTYKQLLGKNAETILLKLPKSGDVIQVIDKAAALKKLKADGVIKKPVREPSSAPAKRAESKESKLETEYSEKLLLAIYGKAPKKISREMLLTIVDHEIEQSGSDLPESFVKALGWKRSAFDGEFRKMQDDDLNRLLFCLLISEFGLRLQDLEKAAKTVGVDAKAIKKAAAAAIAAPPAGAPAKKPKGKK